MSKSCPKSKRGETKVRPVTSSVEVGHVAGPITNNAISAILKAEASLEKLQVAVSYLRSEGSELDRLGNPLTGKVGELYEVLSADALYAGGEP
jgi:hypothetical protein